MLAQYVSPAMGTQFRIVSHGHRWRALQADVEVGRYDSPEEAIAALRSADPGARLPRRLSDWRFIPAAALRHLGPPTPSALARLAAA